MEECKHEPFIDEYNEYPDNVCRKCGAHYPKEEELTTDDVWDNGCPFSGGF